MTSPFSAPPYLSIKAVGHLPPPARTDAWPDQREPFLKKGTTSLPASSTPGSPSTSSASRSALVIHPAWAFAMQLPSLATMTNYQSIHPIWAARVQSDGWQAPRVVGISNTVHSCSVFQIATAPDRRKDTSFAACRGSPERR